MKTILLATTNPGKIRELIFGLTELNLHLLTPKDIQLNFEPEEYGTTFDEITINKALAWAKKSQLPTLADDAGLCIDYLNGEPGIHSHRFFEGSDKEKNAYIIKLLKNVPWKKRTAHYVCAISFVDLAHNIQKTAMGYCYGHLTDKAIGVNGFGFDPLFIPNDFDQTFGQLTIDIKDKISHRAMALAKTKQFLQEWIKG